MSKHSANPRPEKYEGKRKAPKKPLRCRLGLHGTTFSDTTGTLAGGVILTEVKIRCNDCLQEVL